MMAKNMEKWKNVRTSKNDNCEFADAKTKGFTG